MAGWCEKGVNKVGGRSEADAEAVLSQRLLRLNCAIV
jgi:hypothetical protein